MFAHLHVHTHYSLLDSINKPRVLFERAKELGIPALGITEHGNMFSAVECAGLAQDIGVKWIPGLEAYFRPSIKEKTKPYHVTLLAMNDEGYHNLCCLSTKAYTDGFYYKPCVDFDLMGQYNAGLVCLSGCMSGYIPRLIEQEKDEDADKCIDIYREIFGERFFVEVWDHRMQEQKILVPKLLKLADHHGVPVVATTDCHYTRRADFNAHATLVAIGRKNSPKEAAYPSEEFELKSPAEMRKMWQSRPDACDNTLVIADWCDFELDTKTKHAPKFTREGVDDPVVLFRDLVLKGFRTKYGKKPTKEQKERLRHEVRVIEKLGFTDYFLILWDLMGHCREAKIPVGPGRGSAAGSMVAYVLDITRLEPLRYGLLFERFLNEERVSDPDIDIDFCMERRGEVVGYLRSKYGEENVAKIATFSYLHAKGALKDVGRVFGVDYEHVNKLTAMVPDEKMNLLEFLGEMRPKFAKDIPKFEQYITTAAALQEVVRHRSVHAAGLLIGDRPLTELIPLCVDKKHGLVSQYSMDDAESVGLLKMDILGLETLTVIERCMGFIPEERRPDLEAIISEGKFDDPKTWELLQSAQSAGVFQVESFGMRQILTRVQPNCFEDLTAILALYRPGPLDAGMVDEYIERKNGRNPVVYPHPSAEEILKNTYGILVYQEQIMQLVVAICGYSLSQADELRKIIGKKLLDLIPAEKEKFMRRAVEHTGMKRNLAAEIWAQIETFGRYGFNKPHAASYAVISYLTAYLKAHFTLYYMASILTAKIDDVEKFKRFVYETVQRCKIPVIPPHVNESMADCTVDLENSAIRAGLMAVAGIAGSAAHTVVEGRQDEPFKHLDDFLTRCKITKTAVVALIESGALDGIIPNRRSAIEMVGDLIKSKKKDIVPLFDIVIEVDKIEEYPGITKRRLMEKALGMHVLRKKNHAQE